MNSAIGITEVNKHLPFIEWLSELEDLLSLRKFDQNIQFLADCCARLYGNYVRFDTEVGWGDSRLACSAIQFLRNFSNSEAKLVEAEQLRRALEGVAPDTEVFTSVYTSAALDTIGCITEALEYCADRDLKHCVQVACLCRDTVYMFVQQRDDLDYSDGDESRIYRDALVERELRAQQSSFSSSSRSLEGRHEETLASHDCDPARGSLIA